MATQASDQDLVDRLRAGDQDAFAELVRRYHRLMLRVARGYVRTDAVAEEVVQEAWLAVLRGIDRFEGRSSFKTWLLRIVANRAMTQGVKEARSVPFASLEDDEEPSVSPERFHPAGEPGAGAWSTPPEPWPEDRVLAAETRAVIEQAIEELPGLQRAVVSRAGPPRRSSRRSTSRPPTSACCCTAAASAFARRSRPTSRRPSSRPPRTAARSRGRAGRRG